MKKTLLALFVFGALSIGTLAQDQHPPVLDAILSTLSEMKADIGVIKTDIAVMKNDIAWLKTDVAKLKTDVSILNSDVAGIKASVSVLKEDVQSIFSVWIPLFLAAAGTVVLAIIKLVWSSIANKNQKEPNAIRSSSQPELTGLRPKQRAKARPAT